MVTQFPPSQCTLFKFNACCKPLTKSKYLWTSFWIPIDGPAWQPVLTRNISNSKFIYHNEWFRISTSCYYPSTYQINVAIHLIHLRCFFEIFRLVVPLSCLQGQDAELKLGMDIYKNVYLFQAPFNGLNMTSWKKVKNWITASIIIIY